MPFSDFRMGNIREANGGNVTLFFCFLLTDWFIAGYNKKIMIRSFAHKGLKKFHYDGIRKGVQSKHAAKLADILDVLEFATTIDDMNQPGYDLHLLEPKNENRWAVKVSKNWRVTFNFENGNACKVDYEDYH